VPFTIDALIIELVRVLLVLVFLIFLLCISYDQVDNKQCAEGDFQLYKQCKTPRFKPELYQPQDDAKDKKTGASEDDVFHGKSDRFTVTAVP
jgi:hypothetical protein